MAFTLHFLRPGDLFVDVGANIGSYTILAGATGADVMAFEPGERFADLKRNIEVNAGISVDCRETAVGASAGQLSFTVGLDTINRAAATGENSRSVPVVRLDDVVERAPMLIKVDVEGYEAAVLAGGERTFGQAQAVIMELCGQGERFGFSEDEIRRTLAGMGYAPMGYDPDARRLTSASARPNTIFVRGADAQSRLTGAPRYRVHGLSI
jgi:FkbM family methyltransferase